MQVGKWCREFFFSKRCLVRSLSRQGSLHKIKNGSIFFYSKRVWELRNERPFEVRNNRLWEGKSRRISVSTEFKVTVFQKKGIGLISFKP